MDVFFWGDSRDVIAIILVCLTLAYCIIVRCMEHAEWQVQHTPQDPITFMEGLLNYNLNDKNPTFSAFPAVGMVPGATSVSELRSNQFIANCIICLTPTAARCSGCRSVPYCSRKCQLIHWRKEHKEKCHHLSPSANAAVSPRPQMDFLVSLKLQPHGSDGSDTKIGAIREGTSNDQSGTQSEKIIAKKSVSNSKQIEFKDEDDMDTNPWNSDISSEVSLISRPPLDEDDEDANSWLSDIPSEDVVVETASPAAGHISQLAQPRPSRFYENLANEEYSGTGTTEETLQNQDGTMPRSIPQNRYESTKESGQKNENISSFATSSLNSGNDAYADFEAGMHQSRSIVNQFVGHLFEEKTMRGTAGCNKASYSSEKSVHLLEELQDSKVKKEHLLELEKPQDVPSQTANNSMQTHETNRLEEELKKKLEELRDELLNVFSNMQNNWAKELDSLRQQVEDQATKNNDVANFMEFSYLELKEATNNFDEKLKVGKGGYGSVYKAVLHCTTVAIKIAYTGGHQGRREFDQEVEFLRKVRHPNIVTLIGGCSQYLALVYEFIPNGSLENYLGDARGRRSLSWKQRIEIASNICSALIFLHSTKPHGIAHGDLKPANILLDSKYQGKLSDFGISRQLMKTEDTITPHHLTEQPKGTAGYIDPEFLRNGEMNPQCDVYSFGIILLPLVTGKPAIYGKPATAIYAWVQEALRSNRFNKEIDPSAEWPSGKAIKMAKLGLDCCNPSSKERPNLATKVWREIESLKPDASN